VSNRGPHEPRADGTFRRGAGGVITGLLTLAEAVSADWVACARSEAERKLLFAPMGRSIRARTQPGSGLGLSIVKDIAESHGGSVTLEQASGGGARFRLRLATSS